MYHHHYILIAFKSNILTRTHLIFHANVQEHFVIYKYWFRFENLQTIMNKRKQSTSYLPPILDEVITWDDVDWLRTKTKLPIILKGILTGSLSPENLLPFIVFILVESALESLNHKVDGIFVSNHGGRQLDGVTATVRLCAIFM